MQTVSSLTTTKLLTSNQNIQHTGKKQTNAMDKYFNVKDKLPDVTPNRSSKCHKNTSHLIPDHFSQSKQLSHDNPWKFTNNKDIDGTEITNINT